MHTCRWPHTLIVQLFVQLQQQDTMAALRFTLKPWTSRTNPCHAWAASSTLSFWRSELTWRSEQLKQTLLPYTLLYMTHNLPCHVVAISIAIYLTISLVPRPPPFFCSSVFVQYNTRKRCEKRGRPGNTYHVNDVWWTRGGRMGGGVHVQITH